MVLTTRVVSCTFDHADPRPPAAPSGAQAPYAAAAHISLRALPLTSHAHADITQRNRARYLGMPSQATEGPGGMRHSNNAQSKGVHDRRTERSVPLLSKRSVAFSGRLAHQSAAAALSCFYTDCAGARYPLPRESWPVSPAFSRARRRKWTFQRSCCRRSRPSSWTGRPWRRRC